MQHTQRFCHCGRSLMTMYARFAGPAFSEAGDWRAVFGAAVVLGLPMLLLACAVPESSRWLVLQGRPQEAVAHQICADDKGNPAQPGQRGGLIVGSATRWPPAPIFSAALRDLTYSRWQGNLVILLSGVFSCIDLPPA